MTLLKRKSALWHGRAILLLDWVSGPLKTRVAQFPRKEHTSHQALTNSTSGRGGRLRGEQGRRRGRWGGGVSGGPGEPACPNCRHSAAASITTVVGLFLQSLKLGARQQSRLKTLPESTQRAEREEWMANGFIFVTLVQHLLCTPVVQPCSLTSAKCVLKRRESPVFRPRSFSPLLFPQPRPPPLPPLTPLSALSLLSYTLFHSLDGRVALLSLHGQDLWSQGLWQKQKGICQYLWETLCQPSSSSSHWCTASLGMHLSDT